MKIYTRTGDEGDTGLWGGGRTPKDEARIHAYGTIDECNAVLGVVRTCGLSDKLEAMLAEIQNLLFVAGSDLATPGDQEPALPRISEKNTAWLEECIDILEKDLPRLKQFIIPGGSPAGAYLHMARTVCRRAERWAVAPLHEDKSHRQAVVFLNRLSDLLFVTARTANLQAGNSDIFWENPEE